MEGHASPMVPSGGFSGPEHRLEGSNSNSTEILSSGGDHGDRAEGTARGQKRRRKVRSEWSIEQTQQLLDACLELKGRCRILAPKWQSISRKVNGKTAVECRRRMETLTKSFNIIQKYCTLHQKQFDQLGEECKRLELPTKMKSNWYDQMCKIKEQPQNGTGVSSRVPRKQSLASSPAAAAVMIGFFLSPLSMWSVSCTCSPSKSRLGAKYGPMPELTSAEESSKEQAGPPGDAIREVVGTPEPASAARDPEYLQLFEGLEDLGYLSPLRA